jgi:hypothetical protein
MGRGEFKRPDWNMTVKGVKAFGRDLFLVQPAPGD